MKQFLRIFAPLCVCAFAGLGAQAQFYKIHNADVGGSAIGQFTTQLTSNSQYITQATTNSFGGLATIREHPFPFAGVEFNYGYTEFADDFAHPNYFARFKTDMHEATAAYLFHPHFRKLQPFVGVGGGAVDFVPHLGNNQWRAAGLLEVGFDIPTSNPHFGFKIQGRSLYYRSPNYGQANLAARSWVVTEEPSLGSWYRF